MTISPPIPRGNNGTSASAECQLTEAPRASTSSGAVRSTAPTYSFLSSQEASGGPYGHFPTCSK
ncbi:uncharacterized protein EI90DRAFT_3063562 [Cantharellus anzutake]|uniref:uncharacterized protein n=1 Tax=Cantharellus anzutake TaxID=1750568 RepID=UPI001906188B|nr:uncharacterized protein EI90DRAFT_3063562 [Cantharellus anzutake]KAF8328783.1 hypothetical protein EI90DRAFT_3063562 [Cantharellus anzutake]